MPNRRARGGWMSGFAPVCRALIAANVAVYIVQLLGFGSGDVVTRWLELDPEATLRHGQLWRVVTSAFCHSTDGLLHIAVNMFVLWQFGPILELQYGSREFLAFYLAAAVGSSLLYLGVSAVAGDVRPAIGASGAICAVFLLFAMRYPRQRVLLFLVFPIEIRWALLGFLAWDLAPVLRELGGARPADGVAHAAHLGGLLFGFLYFRCGGRITGLFGRGARGPRLRFIVGETADDRRLPYDPRPQLRLRPAPEDRGADRGRHQGE